MSGQPHGTSPAGGRRGGAAGLTARSLVTVSDPHLGGTQAPAPPGARRRAGGDAARPGRPEGFPAAASQTKSVPAGGAREAIVHLLFAIRLDLVALAAYRHCP